VHGTAAIERAEPELAPKVDFLSRPDAYDPAPPEVERKETHMSWVFLAGERVYKLKKPVRFPYLDFSALPHREAACRAELRLNRRLASDIYLDVIPLTERGGRLSIGGGGHTVDWLVMMNRLDERFMLDRMIAEQRLGFADLNRVVDTLARFYRSATPAFLSPAVHLADWRQSFAFNKRVLLDPRFQIPAGLVRWIDQVQRQFLRVYRDGLVARMRRRRLVDGHGDLRPEHIWLDDKVRIIDCLEFNPRLRIVDPFDEVAFLGLECERLGAAWAADYLLRRMKQVLRDGPVDELFVFYRCHRATLRARLAIAHLLEPHPRTPEKWPMLAAAYLALAERDARKLARLVKKPSNRRGRGARADGGSLRRAGGQRVKSPTFCFPADGRAGTAAPHR
jgi:aminoglycoside phosphotransferase family enzyme